MKMDFNLNYLADEYLNQIKCLHHTVRENNENLLTEIETEKEIFTNNEYEKKHLIENQLETFKQIHLTKELIRIEELKRKNLLAESQCFIDCIMKENKEKIDYFIDQIEYYKMLYHIDMKLIKDNRSILITFLKNNQQIMIQFTGANKMKATYEENIDELIENCAYEMIDKIVKEFNENTSFNNNESIKKLILSINEIF